MKKIYFILGGAAVVLILAGVVVYCFVRETDPEEEEQVEHMGHMCQKEPMEYMGNMADKDEHIEVKYDSNSEQV